MVKNTVAIDSTFYFNFYERSLKFSEDEIYVLGENEARILHLLIDHPYKEITRKEIYQEVWKNRGIDVDDSSITQAISTLRKSLGDSAKSPRYIMTVPKTGYKFIATVEFLDNANDGRTENNSEVLESNNFDIIREEYIRSESIDSSLPKEDKYISMVRKMKNKVIISWYELTVFCFLIILTVLLIYDFNDPQGTLFQLYNKLGLL
ncbi:transcriptional regulator [Vibrio olivae]|uniref:Transcriptional regulator n=1 Tax=Vibrio olivae TaxID=1243002 RepID=A0ABV5HJV5_9VIBR